ncbi:MAG TPA: peptidylprolyl isomerase [Gammaproteobacteria bacterium]|nr:peptidylprolyl isomerase [Gammaproteobacteria bacterium]
MQRFFGRMLVAVLALLPLTAAANSVLVEVGDQTITGDDLDKAVASSPFASQFPSMDMKDQAALRGEILQGLVTSRLLLLEAKRRGLHQDEAFQADVAGYRRGLLYRAYMNEVRAAIEVPEDRLAEMTERYKGEPEALKAAKSKFIGDRYKTRKLLELQRLKDVYGFKAYDDRIAAGAAADTVLAEAEGFTIRLADLQEPDAAFDGKRLENKLYDRAEAMLVALAAEEKGMDVSEQVRKYRSERLPAFLMARLEKEWIPGKEAERAYFDSHPELGRIPERRHIVQIVVASRDKAESLRQRITDGESMYKLAKEHSIDPYGAEHAGDMGWLKAGLGMPRIEKALDKLEVKTLSRVIETPKGFHLVRIEEKKPPFQKDFEGIRDRVRRAMLDEKLPGFLQELQDRYTVEWKMEMMSREQEAKRS